MTDVEPVADDRPNVALRRGADGRPEVVLAFPYDPQLVGFVRAIPGRRFDWESRRWSAPADDWAGVHVLEVLERAPELSTSTEVDLWLRSVRRRWIGRVRTARHDGRGWFRLEPRAGTLPEELQAMATEVDGALLVPMVPAAAAAIAELGSARLDAAANRCVQLLQHEDTVPPARLVLHHGTEGERLRLEALWDPDSGDAFERLPGVEAGGRTLPLDPWIVGAARRLPGPPRGRGRGRRGRGPRGPARRARRGRPRDPPLARHRGRADARGRRDARRHAAAVPVGRRPLRARRAPRFLADEQGLGKTVQALAALEADDAFPAVVVCPASLKLDWEREAAQAGCRTAGSRSSKGARRRRRRDEITIVNFEVVAAHREALAPPRAARARRRRGPPRQEPAGQAHPGRPPAGRRRGHATACAWR